MTDIELPPVQDIVRWASQYGLVITKLGRVASTDLPVLQALSAAWDRIREELPAIVPATFDLQPGRSSGCDSVEWDTAPVLVLNLKHRDDSKLPGREILTVLLHQAAHAASRRNTGAEGRYHGRDFATAAKQLGLAVSDEWQEGYGWPPQGLARGTLTRYGPEIRAIDKAMSAWDPVVIRSRDRGPVPYVCACDPPRRLRMNKGVADLGPVICFVCGQPFTVA